MREHADQFEAVRASLFDFSFGYTIAGGFSFGAQRCRSPHSHCGTDMRTLLFVTTALLALAGLAACGGATQALIAGTFGNKGVAARI